MLLTVLIPSFNEAAILADTVRRLEAYFETAPWRHGQKGDWEILFVDDGSTDNTATALQELARQHPRVRFISYRQNGGQGKALQRGIEQAGGVWIFCVDADLDYAPDHVAAMLEVALRRTPTSSLAPPSCPAGRCAMFRLCATQ